MPAERTSPPPPREPEIEFLGRLARRALLGLRVVLWCAGATAVAAAFYMTVNPQVTISEAQQVIAPLAQRVANNLVFVCFGLPYVLPSRWLFGRGRWLGLGIGACLWLGPMGLPGDHEYGFVIRTFASFVACASLLVLRTLAPLTAGSHEPPASRPSD